jgi:hypothetical protein
LDKRKIKLAGLEVGNEINWSAFNGDFDVPGEGRVYGLAELEDHQHLIASRVARGYEAYVNVVAEVYSIRQSLDVNRLVPIISAGLADAGLPGARGKRLDAVSINATLSYLRSAGMDRYVDAYGIHMYPNVSEIGQSLSSLGATTLSSCSSSQDAKPCWISEWGVPSREDSCSADVEQLGAVSSLLKAMDTPIQTGRVVGLIYFSWTGEPRNGGENQFDIYRCGAVTQSGSLILRYRNN